MIRGPKPWVLMGSGPSWGGALDPVGPRPCAPVGPRPLGPALALAQLVPQPLRVGIVVGHLPAVKTAVKTFVSKVLHPAITLLTLVFRYRA